MATLKISSLKNQPQPKQLQNQAQSNQQHQEEEYTHTLEIDPTICQLHYQPFKFHCRECNTILCDDCDENHDEKYQDHHTKRIKNLVGTINQQNHETWDKILSEVKVIEDLKKENFNIIHRCITTFADKEMREMFDQYTLFDHDDR